jgi:hypothetical protein
MRQLAIRQPLLLPGIGDFNLLVGATNLGQLHELQSLDLRSATIPVSSIAWLPALTALTQVLGIAARHCHCHASGRIGISVLLVCAT